MASARKKNGKWYYRITLTVGDGSHKYIERGSFRTKKEAIDAGTKAEVLYKEGGDISRKKIMSFDFLSKEWLKHCENYYKPGTIYEFRKIIKRDLGPYLNNFNVSAISMLDCQRIIDDGAKNKRSYSSLKAIRSCLNNIFKYAVRCGYIKSNPCTDVELPSARSLTRVGLGSANHTKVMPKEEINAIFKRFPEGYPVYIPLILGYRCGLRIGEAFAVFIDDIDFENGKLHVRRQIQIDANGDLYFTDTKYSNPGDERVLDLDKDTLRILRRHIDRIANFNSVLHFPVYREDENRKLNTENGKIIFPISIRLSDGKYVSQRSIAYVSRVIHGKQSTIDYVDPNWDFHSLRHTHASECLAAGMDPVSLQRRLGHKSLSTTYNCYIHETETQVTKSRDIINKMFN